MGWAWPQTQPDAAWVRREPEEGQISGTVVPGDSSSQEGVHPGSSALQAQVDLGGSHLSRTRVRVVLSPPHTHQVAVLRAVPSPPHCLVILAPTVLLALSPAMGTRGPLLPPGWQSTQTSQ